MSKEEIEKFEQQIKALKTVTSVRGKIYHSFSISGDSIHFRRNKAPNYEKISIYELYMFYTSKMELNTTNARDYISGKVQSPAVAILNALETKSTNKIAPSKLKATELKVYKEEKQKDEKDTIP